MSEAILIPLWGKLLLLSVAKKGLILTGGYLYGFPRLYRRAQKLVRWSFGDKVTRERAHASVQTAFRLPAKVLHWNQQPKSLPSPARSYLQQLPSRLLPRYTRGATKAATKTMASEVQRPMLDGLQSIKSSFASSAFVTRQTQLWALKRQQVADLRLSSSNFQLEADDGKKMASVMRNWRIGKPSALIPAIALSA